MFLFESNKVGLELYGEGWGVGGGRGDRERRREGEREKMMTVVVCFL